MPIGSNYKAVAIGGSAGSFSVVSKLLSQIREDFNLPVIICLHRLKHVRSGLVESMRLRSNLEIIEPNDKDKIEPGKVYIAPSNYHLFVEYDGTFSLSTEPPLNHSRPSIDHTLSSAAYVYRNKLIGIVLTGANKDGAAGMKDIAEKKGLTIIQDPGTCEIDTMPKSVARVIKPDKILTPGQIVDFLNQIAN